MRLPFRVALVGAKLPPAEHQRVQAAFAKAFARHLGGVDGVLRAWSNWNDAVDAIPGADRPGATMYQLAQEVASKAVQSQFPASAIGRFVVTTDWDCDAPVDYQVTLVGAPAMPAEQRGEIESRYYSALERAVGSPSQVYAAFHAWLAACRDAIPPRVGAQGTDWPEAELRARASALAGIADPGHLRFWLSLYHGWFRRPAELIEQQGWQLECRSD